MQSNIKVSRLTIQKVGVKDIPQVIQIRATILFPITTTVILRESVKNNITQHIMPVDPHWAMATTKKIVSKVSKLVHLAATGAVIRISRREYWNSKPVPNKTHKLLPGHGKAQRN